jgi:hypothetical protein
MVSSQKELDGFSYYDFSLLELYLPCNPSCRRA